MTLLHHLRKSIRPEWVTARSSAMPLVLGLLLVFSAVMWQSSLSGKQTPASDVPAAVRAVPSPLHTGTTISLLSSELEGEVLHSNDLCTGTDVPSRCSPPQEVHHATRRAPRLSRKGGLRDATVEGGGKDLVVASPLSGPFGKQPVTESPHGSWNHLSPAQASLSTQRTVVLRL